MATLPGFSGASHPSSTAAPLRPAGWFDWLTGGGSENKQNWRCNFDHTETKCIAVTLWCRNWYVCGWDYGALNPIRKNDGWYICGACLGFDW